MPHKAVVYSSTGHKQACAAFARGLRKHGWLVEHADSLGDADMVIKWSARGALAREAKAAGREVCILEMGYLGDRTNNVSVNFGSRLNGYATVYAKPGDSSRLNKLSRSVKLAPYRDNPLGYVLVMGQVPTDYALAHVDFVQWLVETIEALSSGERQVVFRPHPKAGLPDKPRQFSKLNRHYREEPQPWWMPLMRLVKDGLHVDRGSLASALAGAHRVVTFNSTVGVDAALAGVPVIAVDQGSMAWPIAGYALGDVRIPTDEERRQWASDLAWRQWSYDEMMSGECWAHVCPPHFRG